MTAHRLLGAYVGITPEQADRMTPVELLDMRDGEQLRWNRVCRLAAWFLLHIPDMVFSGVAPTQTKEARLPRFTRKDFEDLAMKAPGFSRQVEEEEAAPPPPKRGARTRRKG